MKLRGKFTLAFLSCGLAPLLLATLFSHGIVRQAFEDMGERSHDALRREVEGRLQGQLDAKRYQLKTYANNLRAEAVVMTRVRFFGQMFMQMRDGYRGFREGQGIGPEELARQREALAGIYDEVFVPGLEESTHAPQPDMRAWIGTLSDNAVAVQYAFLRPGEAEHEVAESRLESAYGELRAMGGQYWSDAMTNLGFHDLLLVDGESGEIIFSAEGGIDLGASLLNGPLGMSGAGRAFRGVMAGNDPTRTFFTDADPYLPAYGAPSCFLALPVQTPFGVVGAAIFRIGTERIDAIMGGGIGMGKTGETLLFGPDRRLRADATRDTTGRYTVRNAFLAPNPPRIDMPPARDIFDLGASGLGIGPDYRGQETLFAYAPVDMLGARWGLIVKVDTEEAFAALDDINEAARAYTEAMVRTSDFVVAGAIVLLVVAALLIARPIAQPLRSTVAVLKDMAEGEGDPTVRLEVRGHDEVGDLARWFNAFMAKLEGVYGKLANEVAERERAQAGLQQSERYYRALIENAPDVIAVVDREFRARYLSPAFERTFGYPIAEVLGQDLLRYLAPEAQAAVRRLREEMAEGAAGMPQRTERRVRHADGRWCHVEVTVTPYAEGDAIDGVVLNMRDITERKRAEEEVTRLANFPHKNPSPVMAFTQAGELAYANPATEELAAKLGVPVDGLMPPDHRETLARCMDAADGCESEYPVGERIFNIRYNPVAAAGLVHVYVRDITSRKRAEEVLREYSERLERDVAERTAELRKKSEDLTRALEDLRNTQDRLVLNEKMASLGALTAGIAHEIKNPLNFVNNFAELTAELTEELREVVSAQGAHIDMEARAEVQELLTDLGQNAAKILEHGKRADSIVHSMLLHSRGVAGARHATDINQLLDEYVKLAYHGMRARDRDFNIEIVEDYAPDLPAAEVVPQDVARAFLNIINNACYAARERARAGEPDFQPRLSVATRDAGDAVEVVIGDNGNGIAPEDRDEIFTPFYTTKPAGEGTGLGLSISHDIVVREHGGEIRVESTPGEFTRFTIRLPRKAEIRRGQVQT